MSDLLGVQGGSQAGQVGDVTGQEADLADAVVVEQQPQAARIFLEVVDPDLVAALNEGAGDPAADAAVAAGYQDTHDRTGRFHSTSVGGPTPPSGASGGPSAPKPGASSGGSSRAPLAHGPVLSPSFRFLTPQP